MGPGFVFAGAAIGVSHLVQSTRAGADFGFGLLWALLLINAIKYPFFEFGTRYAAATGKSLLYGYKRLGKGALIAYFLLTFATMFTIQTAVTIVTAGIAVSLFGGSEIVWTAIITTLCFGILILGRYKVLDTLMKVIVLCLTLTTIVAVVMASEASTSLSFSQTLPNNAASIAFLIAFMGWMPAPLDISIWQSMWTVEKKKLEPSLNQKQSLFDYNVGYLATTILAIGFLALGAHVMFGSGSSFSTNAGTFANQLIDMYAFSLGEGAKWIIAIVALTTMFSTTLTTLDGSPRVMKVTSEILTKRHYKRGYLFWLAILAVGTLIIFFFFLAEMGLLIKIATILSFLTAPFYAILNYKVVTSTEMPQNARPSKGFKMYALLSIGVLVAFSIWYLTTL
ncbi:Nramp family divalent metal transporter [Marinirhabdus gelatinilytica]|uniref:Nramp family divalent metal transporter n=1 Tax=Marinirhabdus gelatinilytica TaxID=1703343 RepID=UPI001FEB5770|nr:Nramp family divalent metal transporter [Marinirhabdus gelatinilytica]